jgi:hypothetical protein
VGDFKLSLTGTDRVISRLNKEVTGIKNRTVAGVLEAGLTVKSRSMELTPVDTGNLRRSCYVNGPIQSQSGPGVEIGYHATYAPFVHEVYRHWKSGKVVRHRVGQWKFLETALKELAGTIVAIIRKRAAIT